jgi:hypothetical protein
MILSVVIGACKSNGKFVVKTFSDASGKPIGDSVFLNGILQKIIFNDSAFYIDSIVFKRYDRENVRSINTYMNGRQVFQNIDYYESGEIKTYSFLDEQKSDYYYKRNYNINGDVISEQGTLFFQGYLSEIDAKTLVVKKGKDMNIKIFFPNPPDCKAFLYVNLDDNKKADVFSQNQYITFLKSVSVSNNNKIEGKIWTLIDVWLELQKDKDTLYYNKPIYYKIVD